MDPKQTRGKLYPSEASLLSILSGKWTVLVVYTLSDKIMRHSELRRSVCGISQKMLTQTLRSLEENGIVMRTVYPVVPPQVEYSLTPLGKSLLEVLNHTYEWAKEHQSEVEQAREAFAATKMDSKVT